MWVIIKSECFFTFCGEESLITQTNSPGLNKIKAWYRLRTRTSDYTYGLKCMNYQRIWELSWQSVISVKTISMTQSTWSWKLWLRLIKLECLFMWMEYNNIQKIVLQWIFQASFILSKLDKITTCWNKSWMLMMCHEMRKERKKVMVIVPKNRFLLC